MTDLFLPPSEQEKKQLLEIYGDALVFPLLKEQLRALGSKEYLESCEVLWFVLTKQMFRNYVAADVLGQVEFALEQVADEQNGKYPEYIFTEPKATQTYTSNVAGKGITAQITREISIIDIAEQFGIRVKGNKAVCPFHADKDPSLVFYEQQGRFCCFGCQARGNIIKFYAMLKELKPDFVYHKQEAKI